jgi:hypothetical protein
MAQKKYQQLREKNLRAAQAIARHLKNDKVISEETFGDIYVDITHGTRGGSFHDLIQTTKEFLFQHGIMNQMKVNGLIIYVATQKCFRSKLENMFVEYQTVSNYNLDEAIRYQKINDGKVDVDVEGKVIAENILGLEGKVAKLYAEYYGFHMEHISNNRYGGNVDPKYGVLGPIRDLPMIKKI